MKDGDKNLLKVGILISAPILIAGLIGALAEVLIIINMGNATMDMGAAICIFLILLIVISFLLGLLKRLDRNNIRLEQSNFSDNPHDYIIKVGDYTRNSHKEREYRKRYFLILLQKYNNACANCGKQNNGIDLDHLFLPKNYGGCFKMAHKDGYFVNNAVPLCEHCNRSKSDRSYKHFFKFNRLTRILEVNKEMSKIIN